MATCDKRRRTIVHDHDHDAAASQTVSVKRNAYGVAHFQNAQTRTRSLHASREYLSGGVDYELAMEQLRPSGSCCVDTEIGDYDVSLVLPVHSQPEFLTECMGSVHHDAIAASASGLSVEVSLWDDWADPATHDALLTWLTSVGATTTTTTPNTSHPTQNQSVTTLRINKEWKCCDVCGVCFVGHVMVPGAVSYRLVIGGGSFFYKNTLKRDKSGGIGFAKNRAVAQSCGTLLVFQDSDDVLLPGRVLAQVKRFNEIETERWSTEEQSSSTPGAIIGCLMRRIPEGSTPRYSAWVNRVDGKSLMFQRFKETTPIAPTWAMARRDFDGCGGMDVRKAEDLRLIFAHTKRGGTLAKAPGGPYVLYRYHTTNMSIGVPSSLIMSIRIQAFEDQWLGRNGSDKDTHSVASPAWMTKKFSIWNAGDEGKKFFKSLSPENRTRVVSFGDIDSKKIGTNYHHAQWKITIPIVHFRDLEAPCVLCVKLDTTGGKFEDNVRIMQQTKGWVEGVHYVHFC